MRGLSETGAPMNSRERSIGRAHLPYCPRLRLLISRKSETVQITVRGHPKIVSTCTRFLSRVLENR